MKRFFCKVAMIATILAGGFSMTSCSTEDVLKTIESALTIWQQINAGQTLYFSGSSHVQKWTWNEKNEQYEYQPQTGEASYSSHGCNMTVRSGQAAIAIGDFDVEGYNVTDITLPSVTYSNGAIGQEGYGYQVTFKVIKNGKTVTYSTPTSDSLDYPYATAEGIINEKGELLLNAVLFMSETEAFNVEYKGNQIQKQ